MESIRDIKQVILEFKGPVGPFVVSGLRDSSKVAPDSAVILGLEILIWLPAGTGVAGQNRVHGDLEGRMRPARESNFTAYCARTLLAASGLVLSVGLTGCDQLGIETPEKAAERQVADAKAIGGACRHAMRAIEDCYVLNPKAEKSSVFAGWRDMDEYMRENKLEGVAPVVPRPAPVVAAPKASAASDAEEEDAGDEPDAKTSKRSSTKAASR